MVGLYYLASNIYFSITLSASPMSSHPPKSPSSAAQALTKLWHDEVFQTSMFFFLQPLAFKADDWVRIIDDVDVLARLQVRHGDWTPAMKEVAGKVGRVVKVYTDGDVRVKVGANTWTFSPASLRITQGPATQVNNANVNGGADADRHQALNQVQRGPEVSEMSSGVVRLNLEEIVTDAALGNFEGVRNRLSSTPPPLSVMLIKTWWSFFSIVTSILGEAFFSDASSAFLTMFDSTKSNFKGLALTRVGERLFFNSRSL